MRATGENNTNKKEGKRQIKRTRYRIYKIGGKRDMSKRERARNDKERMKNDRDPTHRPKSC